MAGFDLTRASGILKRVQSKKLHEILYSADSVKLNPGFASLKKTVGKKVQTPFGSAYVVPIKHGRVSASSVTYATAQAIAAGSTNGAAPKYAQFLVTPSKYYTVHRVDADVLDRAKDEGAFIDASAEVMKDALQAHMRRLCIHSHGDGSGKVATILGRNHTVDYIDVLSSEVRNFEVGDEIVAGPDALTSNLRNSGTAFRITARSTTGGASAGWGRLALSGDPVAASWAVADLIFFSGDRVATGPTTAQVFQGFFGWVPQTAPAASESFFGVDRSIDTRLGGLRKDCTGLTYRQMVLQACMEAAAEGAEVKRVRLSFKDFANLCQESDDLKSVELSSENTNIGFKGVNVVTTVGTVAVLPDESMPEGHGMVETDNWQLLYAGSDIAKVVDHDGLMLRKIEAADAYEMYVKSMISPVCDAPGHQMHLYNIGS